MYYKTNKNGEIITVSIYQPQTEEWQETDKELVWSIVQNAFVDINEIDEQAEEQALAILNTQTLDEIKANKINELKNARDTEEISPIEYGGYRWDFDEKSIQRINGAIIALGENDTIAWTSADNTEIRGVNAGDLRNVIKASAIRSNMVHVKYRELRERVERCETVDEVNAIHW